MAVVSEADKYAFSEVQPVETFCVAKKDLDQRINRVNSVQVSPEQCPEVSSAFMSLDSCQRHKERNWGTCLSRNVFVILSLVFTVIISLLELCKWLCLVLSM